MQGNAGDYQHFSPGYEQNRGNMAAVKTGLGGNKLETGCCYNRGKVIDVNIRGSTEPHLMFTAIFI